MPKSKTRRKPSRPDTPPPMPGGDVLTSGTLTLHRYLRTASLALLVAYSKLTGNTDPRDPEVLARVRAEAEMVTEL